MRNKVSLFFLCNLLMLLLLGCGNENTAKILVNATTPIEVEDNALNDVSVTLPEEMSRLPKSEIQHDFIKDGNQVGGIVIVDVSDEMLNSPRGENMLKIAGVLGEQLMPHENPDEIEFICAGGVHIWKYTLAVVNEFAIATICSAGKQIIMMSGSITV